MAWRPKNTARVYRLHAGLAGLLSVLPFNGLGHPLETFGQYRSWHSQIKAYKSFGISYKQTVSAFQKNSCFIGKKVAEILNFRQSLVHIHPCEVSRFRYVAAYCLGILGEILLHKRRATLLPSDRPPCEPPEKQGL